MKSLPENIAVAAPIPAPIYRTFEEYYGHYLSLHQDKRCRRLHLLGMVIAVGVAGWALFTSWWFMAAATPLLVYPFAWLGHFLFEKNQPAAWTNPLWATMGDLRMTWDTIRGRVSL